jgi:hypothetical protein
MVLTNDPEVAEKLRVLRFHGSGGSYAYRHIGYCSRLDALQAAILRTKLPHLSDWTEMRRGHAAEYRQLLRDMPITLPEEVRGCMHVYHQFTIRCSERNRLKEHLKSREIDTGVYYPGPLHLEQAYRYLGYRAGDFPQAERACGEVLSIPIFPEMSDQQLAHVAGSMRLFYE